ncbi:hypothetical protein, partial [Mycobacterium marinum]|uniref:hypothetical protein n=1 Tax=Mycobacterium marinum TaxID=1781 RepID=UPI0023597126
SVGHEDLSVIGVCVVTTPIPEVLTYFPLATPLTTSLGVTPSALKLSGSQLSATGARAIGQSTQIFLPPRFQVFAVVNVIGVQPRLEIHVCVGGVAFKRMGYGAA